MDDSTSASSNLDFYAAPTLPPPPFCHEDDVMYEPIDLNYSMSATVLTNITDCQLLCRSITACGFYTWYDDLKLCHLARPTAVKQTGRPGFQAGPSSCGDAQQAASPETAQTTMMMKTCMLTNISFDPISSRGRAASTEENEVACQNQCKSTRWCAHFVYNTLLKTCNLQDDSSEVKTAQPYEIAGPPNCDVHVEFNATLHEIAQESTLITDSHAMLSFVGLVEAAIISFAGNFTPYRDGQTSPPEPLIAADNIQVTVTDESDKVEGVNCMSLLFNIRFDQMQKALYVATLFNGSFPTNKLNNQIEAFLEGWATDYDQDLADVRLEVGEIGAAQIIPSGTEFVSKMEEAYEESVALYDANTRASLWTTPVNPVTLVLSAISVSASLLALSYGYSRLQRKRCHICAEPERELSYSVIVSAEDEKCVFPEALLLEAQLPEREETDYNTDAVSVL